MTPREEPTLSVRRAAGAAVRFLRDSRDALLHSWRHRRAIERLRSAAPIRSIVVVCHGNICRSPYLAAVLHRALPGIDVSSAGFIGPGRQVPEHGRTVALRAGLDLGAHRSRLVSSEVLRRTDMVIVMDARQARYVVESLLHPASRVWIAGDLDAETRAPRTIRDPWDQAIDVFESSYARLDRCGATIVEVLSPSRSAAHP